MNGMAAMLRGTMAASVPMDVPTINLVTGIIATIKMINGVERVALTIDPKIRLSVMFCKIWPLSLVTRITPNGIPRITEIIVETATI
ncbi:hypothetical protein SDC9_167651 [bioreactor metagenome]|uniref:Uncharacterized protein n=1 Tax=bioreactor metagenome TaxID=1076179 RepID=A0A645G8L9_9ZZZZ